MKLLLIISFFLAATLQVFAQERPKIKFGKVSPEDFATKIYSVDSNANAVVIADIGSTEMKGNTKGNFSLEFTNFRRARILNKNGYDIADVVIPLYTNGRDEEELFGLKAVTYNLENGKVVETKLDVKSAVFKDKINEHWIMKKFTFPNLKEGSIIEYEYKIESEYIFNLRPWTFQGDYGRLWSEYTVSIPEFYYYVTLSQGYLPFTIKDRKDRRDNFSVTNTETTAASERTNFSAAVSDYRWAIKDVPPLKEEGFTSTLDNHVAKLEFQLAELRYPFTPRNIMGNWESTCKDLMEREDFGAQLDKDNFWLKDVVDEATGGSTDKLEKARRIFAYVRDNMTCTNYNRTLLEKNLRNVLKGRNGNDAEINLLLTAMLRKAGFSADPVMLSTRSHGYVYALYPLVDRFNYVITRLMLDGKTYYLDASHPRMGFGKLGYECYNGHARVINAEASPLELLSDSITERKVTSVFMVNDEKGGIIGSMQQTPGYYESARIRDRVKEKGSDQLFQDIKKGFNGDIEISDPKIDSLNKYDDPISISYKFEMKTGGEDLIYINPMFGEAYKENPFKSAQRYYPVEMPYAIDETYLLRIDVPQGYEIDELPKQLIVKLNEDDDGMFEYRLSESNGIISMRSRLRLKRAYYLPEEYEMLRAFFGLVVKKHAEQIVFKKKK